MRPAILTATGAMAMFCLAGCGAVLHGMVPHTPPQKTVPAEYSHLDGHKLAVIVWTHQSTQMAHPDLEGDLAAYVQDALKKGLKGMTFISQNKILRYKETHPRWTDTPPQDLGRKFGAEMALYLTVDLYTLTRPGQMYYQRGRLTCSSALFDLSKPRDQEKVWFKPKLSAEYPPKEYGAGISTNPRKTKTELLLQLSEKLTNCFRQHKEPVDE